MKDSENKTIWFLKMMNKVHLRNLLISAWIILFQGLIAIAYQLYWDFNGKLLGEGWLPWLIGGIAILYSLHRFYSNQRLKEILGESSTEDIK